MLKLSQFVVEDRDAIFSLVRQRPWAVVTSAVDVAR